MDHKRAEEIQHFLDLTVEIVNELSLTSDFDHLSSLELFQIAVLNGIEQYHFVSKKSTNKLSVGKIDTSKVAFQLHDKETVAVIQGDIEFAELIDLDYIGGENDAD